MKIVLVLLTLLLASCTDETQTRRVLDEQGFTEVRTTGYQVGACSEDDNTHTGFIAKNPQGKTVSGVVCCSYGFKGCTIRW